jgi:hypothetical protein
MEGANDLQQHKLGDNAEAEDEDHRVRPDLAVLIPLRNRILASREP